MKKKIFKNLTVKLLCLALILCIVSMVGGSLIQSDFGSIKVTNHEMSLADMGAVIRANNEVTGKDIQIHFTEDAYAKLSFRMFTPKNLNPDEPVAAIVAAHGGDNTLEIQLPFYVELARRGYVVLAMDFAGHGDSDNAVLDLTSNSYGMLAAVEYLMSIPGVDHTKIGLTGHSMGNLCSLETLNVLNAPESTQRVRAWVLGDGTLYSFNLSPEIAEGLIMTMNVGKYSEMDVIYVGAYDYLGTTNAVNNVKVFYPEFAESRVVQGQWYGADGPIDAPAPGEALAVDKAFSLYNYENTHPGWHFSKGCTAICIDGMYAGLGTPVGAEYIPSSNQIWPVACVFGFIGLVGFFLLVCALAALLIKTKVFASLKRELPAKETLPSIKDPKEFIVTLLTIAILVFVSFKSYLVLYPLGSRCFDTTKFSANVPNSLGLWTAFCGLFLLVMMCVNYLFKRIAYGKNAELANPFGVAKVDSVSQFLLSLLFVAVVVIIAYIPVVIADKLFEFDFRVCTVAVQTGKLDKLPVILTRYLPMWLLFYVPNAFFNANTRYRDLPDWASALICSIANGLALIVMIVIQYSTIVNKGFVPYPNMTMGGIVACISLSFLMASAFIARYIYKKTGNAWIAGLINGTLACLMSLYSSWIVVDLMFY